MHCIVLCELACDLEAQVARKESTAAAQEEWFLCHTHCTSRCRLEPATRESQSQEHYTQRHMAWLFNIQETS
jgi:hypothetical protein